MRLLADTHVLLWWLADDKQLPPRHREAIADPAYDVWFSAVSIMEISIKASLGKLTAPDLPAAALQEDGMRELPLTAEHGDMMRALPWHHRDPFDRMLIAQAQVERMSLATVDERFEGYDVHLL